MTIVVTCAIAILVLAFVLGVRDRDLPVAEPESPFQHLDERKAAIYENLRFLVFDELHTYRGRQGADVAMLIRRIRAQCKQEITSIGTSATMVSVGSLASQREEVARVATTMFGRRFRPEQFVERLERARAARSISRRTSCPSIRSVSTG